MQKTMQMMSSQIIKKLLVLVATALSAVQVYAANPCALPNMGDGGIGGTGLIYDGGIGGTGHGVNEGIGGTGHGVDQGVGGTGHGLEKGIGGTGRSAQEGIGGTGQKLAVIGVITGFASVCVNGVEVHYDDGTQININGEPAKSANLMVGQLVSMTAERTPKGWNATKINTHDAVSGPVTRIVGANRVEVAGQLVNLPKKLDGVPKVNLGQTLRVQGLRTANGEIAATSVTQANARQTVISGRLDRRANGTLGIGNLEIDGINGLNTGDYVSVAGEMTNGRLRATQSARALEVDANAQQLSIQSTIISVKDNVMQLNNGVQIHTNRPIKAGGLVRVVAQKDKNGIWQLQEVNNQTHDDIMRRVGKRQQSGDEDAENDKDNSGKKDKDGDIDEDNSGSGSNNSGKGSSNSGSDRSGSNSGSGSSNSGSGGDRIRIESTSGGDRIRIDKPSGGDRIRIESPSGGDRVRTDRPSNSGSGRGGRG